jgi:hypothetical protein
MNLLEYATTNHRIDIDFLFGEAARTVDYQVRELAVQVSFVDLDFYLRETARLKIEVLDRIRVSSKLRDQIRKDHKRLENRIHRVIATELHELAITGTGTRVTEKLIASHYSDYENYDELEDWGVELDSEVKRWEHLKDMLITVSQRLSFLIHTVK